MNHNNDTAAANALDRLLGLAERAVLNDLARVEIDMAIRMRKDARHQLDLLSTSDGNVRDRYQTAMLPQILSAAIASTGAGMAWVTFSFSTQGLANCEYSRSADSMPLSWIISAVSATVGRPVELR